MKDENGSLRHCRLHEYGIWNMDRCFTHGFIVSFCGRVGKVI